MKIDNHMNISSKIMNNQYQIIVHSHNKDRYNYIFCKDIKNVIEGLLYLSNKGMVLLNRKNK